MKNSATALIIYDPTIFQLAVKNSAWYPAGPGDLSVGREKKAFWISSLEKGAARISNLEVGHW